MGTQKPLKGGRARRGPPAAPRVVLDTTVLLSALLFAGGELARLRPAWQAGRFVPLASTATVQELLRTLGHRKFGLGADEQQELLGDYLPWAEVVVMPDPPPAVPACRDPHDLPFLQLAAAGRAQALVTGDADLLVLADARAQAGWVVMPPAVFVRQWAGPSA